SPLFSLMRFSLLLCLLISSSTWNVVLSRGGRGGGGRGFSGGRSSSHSSSSSSSSSSHSSPSSSSSHIGGTPRSSSYSSSFHQPSFSHSAFASSLLTSMAVSSMFHHSMSPYSHRYVYVVEDEKTPFKTEVSASREYYFGEEFIPIDNCTDGTQKGKETTGNETIDLILAQTKENDDSINSTICNICTYHIDDNSTKEWTEVEFKDGSRPPSIAWKCEKKEVCCEMDCCAESEPYELKWWMIVLISIIGAILVLLIVKFCACCIRKWCSTDCRTHELPPGPAPPLSKMDAVPPSAPLPPDSRSTHLNASHSSARPSSAASLSGVQPNLPKKQRKYEQH
ncbi:hypothetical protein PMAYCL1PPCAC_29584, partial [Pristionchus mayeri]